MPEFTVPDDRRRWEHPAETRFEAARRLYDAAVVAWDVRELARWSAELDALEIEALYEAIYRDDLGAGDFVPAETAEEVAA